MNAPRNLVERKATIEESGEPLGVCTSARINLGRRRNNLLARGDYAVFVKEEHEVVSVDG